MRTLNEILENQLSETYPINVLDSEFDEYENFELPEYTIDSETA